MTRTRVIEVWFGFAIPTLVSAVALGPGITVGTGAMLLALACAVASMLFVLWPVEQPLTAADVLYTRHRAG